MAKVGEGDNRWIVKEREDGRNCNNWHWSETNMTESAKQRLGEMLVGLFSHNDSTGFAKITEVESCTGEVYVNSRKGKQVLMYELEVKLKWEGEKWAEDGTVVSTTKGKMIIPDISEETYDDLASEMTVTVDDSGSDANKLKESMRKKGIPAVCKQVEAFVKEAKANLQSGKVPEGSAPTKPKERVNNTYVDSKSKNTKASSLEISEVFHCTASDLYNTLLDANRVRACTAADAEISAEVGCKFKMFNGSIEGEIVELVPNEKIVQKWRFSSWSPSTTSKVVMTIAARDDGGVSLKLVQTGVPDDEKERVEKGWTDLFFKRIKMVFGFGPVSF